LIRVSAFLELEIMAADSRKVTVNDQQKPGKAGTCTPRQGHEVIRRDTSGGPILWFGKGNNFHRFKQALSEVSLKEFGNLGKLIQK
jgi:hypothetical protein